MTKWGLSVDGRLDESPKGVIVAVAEVVMGLATERISPNISEEEFDFGDWTQGRYAWELANVQMLREPIACRGAQGLWTPPDDVLAQVREAEVVA